MSDKAEQAQRCLSEADPEGALALLQEAVRARAAEPKLRVFLFQLLAVLGQWERALSQLNVAADLDAANLAMAQMYREALKCELLRAQVFAGTKAPLVFGQPEQWLALLVESLLQAGQGNAAHSESLRAQAFDQAPASAGKLDAQAFEWLADGDMRLGPVCEAIVNGKYYWVPFSRLSKIALEAPSDLRDCVWMPAHFWFDNGGDAVGLIPARYPGSEAGEGPIKLARKTVWSERGESIYHGLGQRVWTTNQGEYALMDVREVLFNAS